MPTRPRSRCTTCKTLHDGTGKCCDCTRTANNARNAKRGTTKQRGLGWDHQQIAAQLLAEATTCALCGLPPTPTDPLTAGHIQAREQGGLNVPGNYQPEHRSCGSRKRNPGRQVTLITGPPCAGKTTYARAHARDGDLILDLDDIARELGSTRYWQHDPATTAQANKIMRSRIASLAGGRTIHAWVIRCTPSGQSRAALARLIRADPVLVILPPPDVLVARALARPDRTLTINAINAWWSAYTPSPTDTMIDTPKPFDPKK